MQANGIGAVQTTVLQEAGAYAGLDEGGREVIPSLIDSVQDRNGVTIFRADSRICPDCTNVEWNHQSPPVVADFR